MNTNPSTATTPAFPAAGSATTIESANASKQPSLQHLPPSTHSSKSNNTAPSNPGLSSSFGGRNGINGAASPTPPSRASIDLRSSQSTTQQQQQQQPPLTYVNAPRQENVVITIDVPQVAATPNPTQLWMPPAGIIGDVNIVSSNPVTPSTNLGSPAPLLAEFDRTSLLSYPKSSTIHTANSVSADNYYHIWQNPRIRKHPYTIAAALCLSLAGIASFGLTVTAYVRQWDVVKEIFLVLTILTGMPGFYQTVYIYFALTGRPGYHFSNIPSFD